jgi:cysteinyl-tRNA synthetase
MQFYNTLTRKKETFEPKEPGTVSMYVCGITAYDYCHIGHARAAVVFDVLVRYLRWQGYAVTFVRNFTDVDDKIINRAARDGRDADEVAATFIQAFHEDMNRLNVLHADYEPKATEHIQDMQNLVQTLLDSGHAYVTQSGDVYFRVRSSKDYGRLSGRNIEELQAGARIEPGEDKEDPLDFALWKHAKEHEPSWPSPWGPGRPGWHIECSAMSERFLSLPLDIHGGGQDLVFPHHENERAQTMAATGREFVRYWLHNGFVQVNNDKMSKSLGNFVTIRDILQHYMPETLRFILVSKHYRSPLDFSWEAMEEAEKGLKRIYLTIQQIEAALSSGKWSDGELPEELRRDMDQACQSWQQSLDDDLNTAAAIGHLFTVVRLANRILENTSWRRLEQSRQLLEAARDALGGLGSILGLFERSPEAFLRELRDCRAARKQLDVERIEQLIQERQSARSAKDFQSADAIRDTLVEMGVAIQDTPHGTEWDVDSLHPGEHQDG